MTYMRLKNLVQNVVDKNHSASCSYVGLENVDGGSGKIYPGRLPVKNDPSALRYESRDILFGKLRPYLAKSFLATGAGIGSSEFLVLRSLDLMDSRFLLYSTLSSPWLEWAEMTSYGTKMPRTSWEAMSGYMMWVPDLGEQRRIADFLDAEVQIIEGVRERMARISEVAGQRHQAFVDLEMDGIAKKYGSCPFRRFILQVEQGSSPLCDNYPASKNDWGVLKVSAVKLGVFSPEENKSYPEDSVGMARYEVREGDVLITRANTPSLVGSVALVPQVREKLLISDKIFRVSLSGALDPQFFVFAASGSRVRGLCAAASHGTSQSMVNLKSGDIKTWPIPAAPLDEQMNVSKKLEESRSFTGRVQEFADRQIDLLQERKRALITAAVTGQIDVTTARGADVS